MKKSRYIKTKAKNGGEQCQGSDTLIEICLYYKVDPGSAGDCQAQHQKYFCPEKYVCIIPYPVSVLIILDKPFPLIILVT